MLKDVLFLTKNIFDEALPKKKNFYNPKSAYDVHRSLQELINKINSIANHYIALDFTEPYLQNSSCEEPSDKWREVLNRDLKGLNEYVKNYLIKLSHLSYSTFESGTYASLELYIDKIYHSKLYCVYVEKAYNIGYLEPNSYFLKINCLNRNPKHSRKIDIYEQKEIDLSTFESRDNLKNELIKINEEFKIELQKLEAYIFERYTMKDLLKNERI